MRVNINKTNNRFFNLVLNPNTTLCEYFLSSLPQLEVWERKYLFRFYTCTSLFFLFNSGPKTKEACFRCERQTYECVMENVRACRSEGRCRLQICYTTKTRRSKYKMFEIISPWNSTIIWTIDREKKFEKSPYIKLTLITFPLTDSASTADRNSLLFRPVSIKYLQNNRPFFFLHPLVVPGSPGLCRGL